MTKKSALNAITLGLLKMYCLLLLFSFLIACGTTKPSGIDSQLTRQEGYEQIKDQLRIYVRPLEDKKEIKRYFGANLLEKNILPVFILAENKNTTRHFLVEPASQDDQVSKNEQNRKIEGSKPQDNPRISSKDAKGTVYETDRERFLTTGPVIWLAILPLAIMSDFKYGPTDSSKSLQQALIYQSLRKQTLTPGRTEQGFLYYQLPPDRSSAETIGISITATDLETQEVMYFRFTKEFRSGGK
jgi:hypothetical protein